MFRFDIPTHNTVYPCVVSAKYFLFCHIQHLFASSSPSLFPKVILASALTSRLHRQVWSTSGNRGT